MSDPKYPVVDGKMSHIDGYVLPEDEPTMVFRGKDIGSLMAICEYVEMLEEQPQNPVIVSHRVSSLERLLANLQLPDAEPRPAKCRLFTSGARGGFIVSYASASSARAKRAIS